MVSDFMNAAMILTQGNKYLRDFCNFFKCYTLALDSFSFACYAPRSHRNLDCYRMVFEYDNVEKKLFVYTQQNGKGIEQTFTHASKALLHGTRNEFMTLAGALKNNAFGKKAHQFSSLVTSDGKHLMYFTEKGIGNMLVNILSLDNGEIRHMFVDSPIATTQGCVQIDQDRFVVYGLIQTNGAGRDYWKDPKMMRTCLFDMKHRTLVETVMLNEMRKKWVIDSMKEIGDARVVMLFNDKGKSGGAILDFKTDHYLLFTVYETHINHLSMVYHAPSDSIIFFGGTVGEYLRESHMTFHMNVATLVVTRLTDLPFYIHGRTHPFIK